jgi:hypothetical protein
MSEIERLRSAPPQENEWHSRYGGRGTLVYWHVERGSVVVHSQTLRASASEVHAMVEGAIRHGTTMNVEGNYVDSHGQSEIGFGITRLLNIDLLPRIKRINKVRLYRPRRRQRGRLPPAYPGADQARPVGHHRRQLRPGHPLCHRDPGGNRVHRGSAVKVHPVGHPPGLPGDAGNRPGTEDRLCCPLPA